MKLFELFAEIALDTSKFDKGVTSATKQGNSMSNTLAVGMQKISAKTIALGNAMYDMGKQAARAVANFAKDSVGAYAEAEQLLGGVETLFKGSASAVIENARKAYTTAGMDANQYMQNVMGFSSSLLQSVGGDTVKAAQYADMAIQDMSDNANKFGTDMASIQNAYQGFAKQNYTLLDNLRLGYGGTKTEMQRLLKDAQAIQRAQGKNVKYSINNLDDVYEAIHVIQQEMGITGTTASEAARTISGSFNSFKSSWRNMIIGLGTGEDMKLLVDNVFETGATLISNLLALVPRVGEQAIRAVDSILQRFDLYRTLRNAYKVGKWQALGSAAVASFKRGVTGFGEWAIEKGSEFLAGLWNGLTGDNVTTEKIKTYLSELFDGASVVLSSLKNTSLSALEWVKDNGKTVAAAVAPMAAAFAILGAATHPLATGLAAIIVFATDWKEFEKVAPNVVSFFEDLTGIDFSDFASGIETVQGFLSTAAPLIVQIFAGAGAAISGIASTMTGALGWVKDNGKTVSGAVIGMSIAFGALLIAVNPLGAALAAIIAFATDWEKFQEVAPGVVLFFEGLSGIKFDNFVSGINSLKEALQSISSFLDNNPEIASAVAAAAATVATAAGHPVVGAGLFGASVSLADQSAEKYEKQMQTMDEWAAEQGYSRDVQPFFIHPAFSYGEADYAPEVYEEYQKYRIQNALDQLKNATPSETPATITGPGGKEVPLMPSGDAGASLERLAAAAEESAAAAKEAAAAAANAAAAFAGAKIEMDGQTVGQIVSPIVSEHIVRQYRRAGVVTA